MLTFCFRIASRWRLLDIVFFLVKGGDSGFGDGGSDFGQRSAAAAAAFMNPFATFQQNADGEQSALFLVGVLLCFSQWAIVTVPTSNVAWVAGFYLALSTATETSSALADETPSPPSVAPPMFYGSAQAAAQQVMPPPSGYSSMYPTTTPTPG